MPTPELVVEVIPRPRRRRGQIAPYASVTKQGQVYMPASVARRLRDAKHMTVSAGYEEDRPVLVLTPCDKDDAHARHVSWNKSGGAAVHAGPAPWQELDVERLLCRTDVRILPKRGGVVVYLDEEGRQ